MKTYTIPDRYVQDIARLIVKTANPGYLGSGYLVNIDTWEIIEAKHSNIYPDEYVDISNLFDDTFADFDGSVKWHDEARNLASWTEMLAAWTENSDEYDAPEDVRSYQFAEVVYWAVEENDEWETEINDYQDASFEAAVALAVTCCQPFTPEY